MRRRRSGCRIGNIWRRNELKLAEGLAERVQQVDDSAAAAEPDLPYLSWDRVCRFEGREQGSRVRHSPSRSRGGARNDEAPEK